MPSSQIRAKLFHGCGASHSTTQHLRSDWLNNVELLWTIRVLPLSCCILFRVVFSLLSGFRPNKQVENLDPWASFYAGGCDRTRRRTKRAPETRASRGMRGMLPAEILKIKSSENAFFGVLKTVWFENRQPGELKNMHITQATKLQNIFFWRRDCFMCILQF